MKIPEQWKTQATQDELLKQKVRFLTLVNGTLSAAIWLAAGYGAVIVVRAIASVF